MLKISKFKLNEGYWADKKSDLTLVNTDSLDFYNKDKVLLDLWSCDWHEDGLKFFEGEAYKLLLDYFEGKAENFCVVRNYEFSEFVWVIHV